MVIEDTTRCQAILDRDRYQALLYHCIAEAIKLSCAGNMILITVQKRINRLITEIKGMAGKPSSLNSVRTPAKNFDSPSKLLSFDVQPSARGDAVPESDSGFCHKIIAKLAQAMGGDCSFVELNSGMEIIIDLTAGFFVELSAESHSSES